MFGADSAELLALFLVQKVTLKSCMFAADSAESAEAADKYLTFYCRRKKTEILYVYC